MQSKVLNCYYEVFIELHFNNFFFNNNNNNNNINNNNNNNGIASCREIQSPTKV